MSVDETSTRCILDRTVINDDTIESMSDVGLSLFATLCGRNRGAFVTDPPDGDTYGCLKLPSQWQQAVGIETESNGTDVPDIVTANDIKDNFLNGKITPTQAVDLFDLLTQTVYQSSPNVNKDPYACNVNGLATLDCASSGGRSLLINKSMMIRSVTLAGLVKPEPWVTGGQALTLEQARDLYTPQDFADMKSLGLNAVSIPLDRFNDDVQDLLDHVLSMVAEAGLKAILAVEKVRKKEPNSIANVVTMATTPSNKEVVAAVSVPTLADVATARAISSSLPLLVSINGGDLLTLQVPDDQVYAALDLGRSHTVADIASGSSEEDRSKLFYHEAIACTLRSPIEYTVCYSKVPVFMAKGFDLSIDDCILQGTPAFRDYGQCDRFNETVSSPWWEKHRASLAARQLFAYEQSLGWSFSAWKILDGNDDDDDNALLDTPAKLMALKHVAAAKLFPDLTNNDDSLWKGACLDMPVSDFILGDETLAPTPGPPPDCGNGWWNYTTNSCSYWIPPPPTPAPVPVTCAPAPDCPICEPAVVEPVTAATTATTTTTGDNSKGLLVAESVVAGAAVAFLISFFVFRGRSGSSQRSDYDTIPN